MVLIYRASRGRRLRRIAQAEINTLGPRHLGNGLFSTLLTNGFGRGTLTVLKARHGHAADSLALGV